MTCSMLTQRKDTIVSPEKPKRPASAYLRYLQEYRAKAPTPETKQDSHELLKKAGESWRLLDNESKLKFQQAYEKERVSLSFQ